MVLITFKLKHDQGSGIPIRVTGSIPELGDWKVNDGLPLTPENEHEATVSIDINEPVPSFEYKYFVEHEGSTRWEPFSNHKATVDKSNDQTCFKDEWRRNNGTAVLELDPYLVPFEHAFRTRYHKYSEMKKTIDENHNGLDAFSKSYENMGIRRVDGGFKYSEWAPNARDMSLVGDFNSWNTEANQMEKDDFGVFHCFIPDKDGKPAIPHGTKVKCFMRLHGGQEVYRIPAWIKYALQEKDTTYTGVHWHPEDTEKHVWKHERLGWPKEVQNTHSLKIYEAHVGMGSAEPKIGSYREFADDVLPRIHALGYNAVQLMAIMEHVYYASFGYHVTSFFAISSRCGTPEDLKYLVDKAHGYGLIVVMDIVHSHASKNVIDGLNQFDGTDHQYFHEGGRGNHDLWDSRLFNYSHQEVLRFLLSNARWFIEEYRFDGYRFDGVTSMLYKHHGNGVGFTGNYDEYFGNSASVDDEAETYLMLVNEVLHDIVDPPAICVAEEVSGMPTLCRPVQEGGLGFDYRLTMAVPDMWIKLLKETQDENWSLNHIIHTLTNRRETEKSITYAESHDQALVGDKTLAFWLMDKEMYHNMSVLQQANPIVERGIALHKLIRLLTCSLGGEGYLNFMGNEFGHPEWVDFPREGNGNSYHHCRRQWNLVDDELLRYRHLSNFDSAMLHLESKFGWLQPLRHSAYVTTIHNDNKLAVYEKADLVFVFNFHASKSFDGYRIGVAKPGTYRIVLSSDDAEFGGHSRVDKSIDVFSQDTPWDDRPYSVQLYLPTRVAVVLTLVDHL